MVPPEIPEIVAIAALLMYEPGGIPGAFTHIFSTIEPEKIFRTTRYILLLPVVT